MPVLLKSHIFMNGQQIVLNLFTSMTIYHKTKNIYNYFIQMQKSDLQHKYFLSAAVFSDQKSQRTFDGLAL